MGRPIPSDASHCFQTPVFYSLGFSDSLLRGGKGREAQGRRCHTTAVGVHTKVLISGQKWKNWFAHSEAPSVHPLSWSPRFSQLSPTLCSRTLELDLEKALAFKGRRDPPWGETDVPEKHRPSPQGARKSWIWSPHRARLLYDLGQAPCHL